MGPEGIILVNPPITTFQQSLTHSAVFIDKHWVWDSTWGRYFSQYSLTVAALDQVHQSGILGKYSSRGRALRKTRAATTTSYNMWVLQHESTQHRLEF